MKKPSHERKSSQAIKVLSVITGTKGLHIEGEDEDPESMSFRTQKLLRNIWGVFLFFPLMYIAFSVPYRVSFYYNAKDYTIAVLITDYCTDFLLWVDVFIRFRTFTTISKYIKGEFEKGGDETEETPQHLQRRTSAKMSTLSGLRQVSVADTNKVGLLIDILGSFPWEITPMILGYQWLGIWRIPRLLRLHRLKQCSKSIEGIIEEVSVESFPVLRRMTRLTIFYIVAGHCAACMFYLILKIEQHADLSVTWIENDLSKDLSIGSHYIASIYWAIITMITTGLGDIVPVTAWETCVTIVVMFVGLLLTCSVIANLSSMMSSLDSGESKFHRKLDTLNKYTEFRELSPILGTKLKDFYHFMWSQFRGLDEHKFLDEIPRPIRFQIVSLRSINVLKKIEFLRNLNEGFIRALAVLLQSEFYTKDTVILRKNHRSEKMYIIAAGRCEQFTPDNFKLVQVFKPGDVFNELAVLSEIVTHNPIKTRTACEVLTLSRADFRRAMLNHLSEKELKSIADSAPKVTARTSNQNRYKFQKQKSIIGRTVSTFTSGKSIWDPDNGAQRVMNLVHFLVVMKDLILIPLTIMFQRYGIYPSSAFLLDLVTDSFYIFHTYLRLRKFQFMRDGKPVTSPREITRAAVRQPSFYADVLSISTVPVDFVLLFSPDFLLSIPLLRLARVLRGYVIFEQYDLFDVLATRWDIHVNTTSRLIVKISIGLLVFLHWISCFWVYLGVEYVEQTWIHVDPIASLDSPFWSYIRAVYYSVVATTTVGYGDIVSVNTRERVYSTAIVFVGGLLYPAIIGALAFLILNYDISRMEHLRKMKHWRALMRLYKCPTELQQRIFTYYEFLWMRQRGMKEENLISELPDSLKVELSVSVAANMVINVPFFQQCSKEFIRQILLVLKPQMFTPGDVIISPGFICKEMFFLKSGTVRVKLPDGTVIAQLHDESHFGESSLISDKLRYASAEAMTYCDCFVLHRDDFALILRQFPKEQNDWKTAVMMADKIKKQREKNIQENLLHTKSVPKIPSLSNPTLFTTHISKKSVISPHFLPNSRFRFFWSLASLFLVVYDLFVVIWRISFLEAQPSRDILIWFIVDYLTDLFFIADVYLRLWHFGYYLPNQGKIVDQKEEITKKYYRSTPFYLDVISVLPLYIFFGFHNIIILASLRILRLLRVHRFLADKQRVEEYLQITFNVVVKLLKLLIGVLLVSHWSACGFYLIAYYEQAHDARIYTWIDDQIVDGYLTAESNILEIYLRAFYWSLPTLVIVVIGDVHATTKWETVYSIWIIIFGTSLNAAIISAMADIVGALNSRRVMYVRHRDTVSKYMKLHHVQNELQERVRLYFDFIWHRRKGFDEAALISDLPVSLRMDFNLFARKNIFLQSRVFCICPDEVLRKLTMCLKYIVVSPDEIIMKAGEYQKDLFLLDRGTVKYELTSKSVMYNIVTAPAILGVAECFVPMAKNASYDIIAIDHCELYSLSHSDIERTLNELGVSHIWDTMVIEAAFVNQENQKGYSNIRKNFNIKLEEEVPRRSRRLSTRETRGGKKNRVQNMRKASDALKSKDLVQFLGISHAISDRSKSLAVQVNVVPLTALKRPNLFLKTNRKSILSLSAIEKVRKRIFQPQKPILPYSNFRSVWEILRLAITLFWLISIPFCFSFLDSSNDVLGIYILAASYTADVFFWVDIYLNFYKFAIVDGGKLIISASSFKQKYKNTHFRMDVFSNLPFEVLCIANPSLKVLYFLRLPRLLRCVRLPFYVRSVDRHLEAYSFRIAYDVMMVVKFLILYIVIMHIYGCIWMIIYVYVENEGANTWATLDGLGPGTNSSLFKKYVRSVYFVLTTLSTVGYGDMRPQNHLETLYELWVVLTASIVFGAFIGTLAANFQETAHSGLNKHLLNLSLVKHYMEFRSLPEDIRKSILSHYESNWDSQKGLHAGVVANLPDSLRYDIHLHTRRRLVSQIRLFNQAELRFLKPMLARLRHRFAATKTWIYRKNDIADEVYFLHSGIAVTVREDDKGNTEELDRFIPGSIFGKRDIATRKAIRKYGVMAQTFCEIFVITVEDLRELALEVPEFQNSTLFRSLLVRQHKMGNPHSEGKNVLVSAITSAYSNPNALDSAKDDLDEKETLSSLSVYESSRSPSNGRRKSISKQVLGKISKMKRPSLAVRPSKPGTLGPKPKSKATKRFSIMVSDRSKSVRKSESDDSDTFIAPSVEFAVGTPVRKPWHL